MTTDDGATAFDAQSIRAKYREERDKRLVADRTVLRDLRADAFYARFRDDPFTPVAARDPVVDEVDAAIIGAGMAGVTAGAELRQIGLRRIRLVDVAGGIGGTWYWNRYPGVMCDVESYIYMPMLEELDYVPKTKYAFGDEIRQHFEAIARKYALYDDALFHTEVTTTEWEDATARWVVRTNRGDEFRAKYLVMAVGILNLMKLPAIEGMDRFSGRSFHTARWDYEYTGGGPDGNLTGLSDKVVAVVGTGASGIQCIPLVVESAKHTYVFQRTPSAIGVRGNRPTDEAFVKSLHPGWQRERMHNFQAVLDGIEREVDLIDDGWTHHYGRTRKPVPVPGLSPEEMGRRVEQLDFEVMELHRRRIDEIVEDPDNARILKPYYRYICKRPCFHDEYLPAFNAPNVTLVDCPAGIERITEHGVIVDGKEYNVDCIIYATGFEPEMTPLPRRASHEVIGRGNVRLGAKWAERASSLFGMMTHRFPNLFIMPAPGQQAVVTVNHTLITVIGAEHIAATIETLEKQNVRSFEVSEDAEADWCSKIVAGFVDGSAIMSACTPSRLNFEGDPTKLRPENGAYGGGTGNLLGFLEVLAEWRTSLARGEQSGLILE